MRLTNLALALLAGLTLSSTAQAALQGRNLDASKPGNEAYYDDVLNITWLADANYAKTSGYDSDGSMSWSSTKTWVMNLSYYGITGWRLPTVVDTGSSGCNWAYSGTDCGYNVQTVDESATPVTVYSELAHMYYNNLGNKAYFDASGNSPQFGWGLQNTEPFSNLQDWFYWSGTAYAPDPSRRVWLFRMDAGSQYDYYYVADGVYAWPVRTGDVVAIPEPETYAMMLAGLGLLGWATRRRRM